MIQIEDSFFDLARGSHRNCLVICDRGAMDASAFISREQVIKQNVIIFLPRYLRVQDFFFSGKGFCHDWAWTR